MNIYEIKDNINIKLEHEDEKFSQNQPIMNIIHCFQSRIPLEVFTFEKDKKTDEFYKNQVNFVFAVKHFNN